MNNLELKSPKIGDVIMLLQSGSASWTITNIENDTVYIHPMDFCLWANSSPVKVSNLVTKLYNKDVSDFGVDWFLSNTFIQESENKTNMKTKIQKMGNGYFIPIPDEILKELNWNEGDDVSVETTLDCYDAGEMTSIIIANVTKGFDK